MATKVTDTAALAERDPMTIIAEGAIFGPGAAIERMEAAGQRELVANGEQLPREGLLVGFDRHARYDRRKNGTKEPEPELLPIWKAWGVSLIALGDDDLFADVKLPAGWKLQATDHGMHNALVDEKGRERAGVFYKAAFYDRKADVTPNRFFRAVPDYGGAYGSKYPKGEYRYLVLARDGREFFCAGPVPEIDYSATDEEQRRVMALHERVDRRARFWLAACFPNHADDAAYWDDELTIPTPAEVEARTLVVIEAAHVAALAEDADFNRWYPSKAPKLAKKPKQGKRKK